MSFNLNAYHKPIRDSVFTLGALPAVYLAYAYLSDSLGINPFATLMKVSGHTTIVFIIITLAITPMRRWLVWLFCFMPQLRWGKRLSDWNVLIRLRRMVGIYGFFYACIHLWTYCYLEMDFYWPDIYLELFERKFILWGVLTWVCLLLLTITSPKIVMKKMRIWWRRLHRLMYPLSLFAVLHYYFAVKVTEQALAILYFFIIVVLLAHRVMVYVSNNKRLQDTGMEVEER